MERLIFDSFQFVPWFVPHLTSLCFPMTQVTTGGRASYYVSYRREAFAQIKLPKYSLPKVHTSWCLGSCQTQPQGEAALLGPGRFNTCVGTICHLARLSPVGLGFCRGHWTWVLHSPLSRVHRQRFRFAMTQISHITLGHSPRGLVKGALDLGSLLRSPFFCKGLTPK